MSLPDDLPVTVTAGSPPAGAGRDGWLRRPWARLIVMVVLFVLVSALLGGVNAAVEGVPVPALLVGLLSAAAAVWAYRKAVTLTEHRPVTELDPQQAGPGLRRGVLVGLALFTATITVIAVFGGYRITGWGSAGALVAAVGLMASVAVTEEILLRGIVFRLVEEMAGTWSALGFSAALFGVLHLVNPDATIWGAAAIAIEAGVMLAAAYLATGSLWVPIGVHFGWNLAQAGIFACTVSGSADASAGLFESTMNGSVLLTGGEFGPEASIVSVLVCLLASAFFLRLARRRGRLPVRRPAPSTLAG
jgi:membrane protease YdiL (CAAX protease family)